MRRRVAAPRRPFRWKSEQREAPGVKTGSR